MKFSTSSIVTVCLLAVVQIETLAQNAETMGRSGCADFRNSTATMEIHPSLLALGDRRDLSFSFPGVSLSGGTDGICLADFRAVTGNTSSIEGPLAPSLSDTRRNTLLNQLTQSHFGISINAQAFALSAWLDDRFVIGLRHDLHLGSVSTLPTQLTSLCNGDIGSNDVRLSNTRVSALAYAALQISTAYSLLESHTVDNDRLTVGLSVKRLQGIIYARLSPTSELRVHPFVPDGWDSTKDCEVVVDAHYDYTSGRLGDMLSRFSGLGSENPGWGFDLSGSWQTHWNNNYLTVVASVLDLGSIEWTANRHGQISTRDTIRSFSGIDESYVQRFKPSEQTTPLSSALPSRVEALVQWTVQNAWSSSERIDSYAAFRYGLNDQGANEQCLRLALAVELAQRGYRPTVRAGFHTGASDGTDFSFGFGWTIAEHLSLSVGSSSLTALVVPSKAQWISCATEIRVNF